MLHETNKKAQETFQRTNMGDFVFLYSYNTPFLQWVLNYKKDLFLCVWREMRSADVFNATDFVIVL